MDSGIGKQTLKVIELLERHVDWLSFDPEEEKAAKLEYDIAYDAVLAEFHDMQDRINALQKDAARYRWLRTRNWSNDLCVVTRPKNNVRLGSDCPSHERLDALIDADLTFK